MTDEVVSDATITDSSGIAARIPNLMDRSRFGAALVSFIDVPDQASASQIIIVDLDRCNDLVGFGSLDGHTIGFGSHVDGDRLAEATEAGFDEVMARSVFFRQLPRLLGGTGPQPARNGG